MAGPRDVAPDVLRGFALWGIILVNVAYFSHSVDSGPTASTLLSTGDATAAFLVFVLAQGKFYLIFSFLFGYSAHYVLRNLETGRRRWWWRSAGLIILGVAHASLLFIGDILFLYGLLGIVVLAFYGRSEKVIRRSMAWIYGAFAFFSVAVVALVWSVEAQGISAAGETSQAAKVYESTVLSGDYLASIPARFDFWFSEAILLVAFQGALTFVAFLAGVLAARAGALASHGLAAHTLRGMMGWGLGLGLGLQLFFGGLWLANTLSTVPSTAVELGSFFGSFLAAPLLSVGYVGLVLTIVRAKPTVLGWLGRMGRMSLTVYLGQSVILSVIFGGWGLGLYQEVPYWSAVVIAVGVTLLLALGATLWLRLATQGPMERLLTAWSRVGMSRPTR